MSVQLAIVNVRYKSAEEFIITIPTMSNVVVRKDADALDITTFL